MDVRVDMRVYLPELDETVDLSAADLGYPTPTRTYEALTLTFDRAFDNGWDLHGSWTLSRSEGNYEGTVKSDNGQDDAGITTSFDQPGLTDNSDGLRYEIRRQFAPYIGVEWGRQLGETGDFARAAGGRTDSTALVAGLRVWF